jgi:hypothetical protein
LAEEVVGVLSGAPYWRVSWKYGLYRLVMCAEQRGQLWMEMVLASSSKEATKMKYLNIKFIFLAWSSHLMYRGVTD